MTDAEHAQARETYEENLGEFAEAVKKDIDDMLEALKQPDAGRRLVKIQQLRKAMKVLDDGLRVIEHMAQRKTHRDTTNETV
jgi:hypothetical protein